YCADCCPAKRRRPRDVPMLSKSAPAARFARFHLSAASRRQGKDGFFSANQRDTEEPGAMAGRAGPFQRPCASQALTGCRTKVGLTHEPAVDLIPGTPRERPRLGFKGRTQRREVLGKDTPWPISYSTSARAGSRGEAR